MRKRLCIVLLIGIGLCAATIVILLCNGVLWFNNPSRSAYPVRGVDVSSYQGEINWSVLSGQGINFAYIKATEGSSYKDNRFSYNWENAGKAGLKRGAYHFFSFESPGSAQAKNFIGSVPVTSGCLPPAVDIELYGEKQKNSPERMKTIESLGELLGALEKQYGRKPILYVTGETYERYIRGSFKDYKVWIRDVYKYPALSDNRGWALWQYSDHQVLKGYKGEEKFIDMNVFNGTTAQFEDLTK